MIHSSASTFGSASYDYYFRLVQNVCVMNMQDMWSLFCYIGNAAKPQATHKQ